MVRRSPRNLSLERLAAADLRVRRRVAVVRGRLAAEGLSTRLVEGSAVAAELQPLGEAWRRRAIRAGIEVAASELSRAESLLRGLGFAPSRGQPTIELMRQAHRFGRSASHAILGEDPASAAGEGGDGPSRAPHPGSPEAAEARARLIGRYRLVASVTLARSWRRKSRHGGIEETLEIGLVASGDRDFAPPRQQQQLTRP
jgi:hypothetical protein